MSAKLAANLGWNTWVLLTLAGGFILAAGCTSDPGTAPPANSASRTLGTMTGAAGEKAPAQATPTQDDGNLDPADGDLQQGEFEGEHQFGANDEVEDGAEDDNEVEDEAEGNELKAILSEGSFRAVVEYAQEADETSFEVEVTGGQTSATLDVGVVLEELVGGGERVELISIE